LRKIGERRTSSVAAGPLVVESGVGMSMKSDPLAETMVAAV